MQISAAICSVPSPGCTINSAPTNPTTTASQQRQSTRSPRNTAAIAVATIGAPFDIVVADLSFISLVTVAPVLAACGHDETDHVVLVKPQFEVGADHVGKGGIVREPSLHAAALTRVAAGFEEAGLGAQAALASNRQVIRVLRLVGARDAYIARAFVRRFTLRSLIGAGIGTAFGLLAILALPRGAGSTSVLANLGFSGGSWAVPVLIPLLAAATAFVATRIAAYRTLRELR